ENAALLVPEVHEFEDEVLEGEACGLGPGFKFYFRFHSVSTKTIATHPFVCHSSGPPQKAGPTRSLPPSPRKSELQKVGAPTWRRGSGRRYAESKSSRVASLRSVWCSIQFSAASRNSFMPGSVPSASSNWSRRCLVKTSASSRASKDTDRIPERRCSASYSPGWWGPW